MMIPDILNWIESCPWFSITVVILGFLWVLFITKIGEVKEKIEGYEKIIDND